MSQVPTGRLRAGDIGARRATGLRARVPDAAGGDRAAEPLGMLAEGRNVWRVARADRLAVLVDAAAYYGVLRKALGAARQSVIIVGWDIDSRTPLVGESGRADDGLPTTLGPFLSALVERNPALSIKLLLWDYSLFYSLERKGLGALSLRWTTPPQVELCLDDELPVGSAQHQKIVVIDDALAFSGGLDLTIRRWDRPEHDPADDRRIDPSGEPYAPFHDVHMMVGGPAARALGELARLRWQRAARERLPAPAGPPSLWPEGVEPDFRDVPVGIARTEPAGFGEVAVHEVERLYEDMIDAAERAIYVENQFLTATRLARRLARRMRRVPALEAVIVVPQRYRIPLAGRAMLARRVRCMEILRGAGVADRVRLVYPHIERDGVAARTMVHSKVMIVDDRLLRVGSANLSDRSMGADTECDLVVEARNAADRERVAAVRNRLLAEHCGARVEEVEAVWAEEGSLVSVVDRLSRPERGLRPVDDGELVAPDPMPGIEALADPPRPIGPSGVLSSLAEEPGRTGRPRPAFVAALALIAVGLLFIVWRYTPLAALAEPERLGRSLALAGEAWAPLVTIGGFVLAGLVAFPVTVMIAATAAAFGWWPGVAYAASGALTSAVVTYVIGRTVGGEVIRRWMGPRINRISQAIAARGVLAVATARLLPVAPFTVVNLVAGASRLPFLDYLIGTVLGLAPGILVMSALGNRLLHVFRHPSLGDALLLAALVLGWIALSFGLQAVVSRMRRRRS